MYWGQDKTHGKLICLMCKIDKKLWKEKLLKYCHFYCPKTLKIGWRKKMYFYSISKPDTTLVVCLCLNSSPNQHKMTPLKILNILRNLLCHDPSSNIFCINVPWQILTLKYKCDIWEETFHAICHFLVHGEI